MKIVIPFLSLATAEQLIFCKSGQDDACQFAFDTLDGHPNDSCNVIDTDAQSIIDGESTFNTLESYVAENCGMRGFDNDNHVRTSLLGYGCWCSFGQKLKFGSGQPVDLQDEICRQLNHNYRCIEIDAAAEGKTCPYDFTDYMVVMSRMTGGTLTSSCDTTHRALGMFFPNDYKPENHDCAVRRCVADTEFTARQLTRQSIDPHGFNSDLKWTEYGGNFDKDTCRGQAGQRDELICCAEYPDRFPIWNSNQTGCCVDKRYNMVTEDCCMDGSVTAVGGFC